MKTLVKANDCNSCVCYKCNRISSEYPRIRTKHKLSPTELCFGDCTAFKNPQPWKIPVLMHLATDPSKVQAMNDLLTGFGFTLSERIKYPYFKLTMKKARA